MSQLSNQSGPRINAQPMDQSIIASRMREKDLERVKQVIEQATDIRQERVERAKLALKEDKLKLTGNDLAEKILADPFNQMSVIN